MSGAMELGMDNFEREILQASGVALVDFWAPWCMPCRMMAPTVDGIAARYAGRVKVGKVNVDENQSIARKYGVMSIPTLVVFKDGEPVSAVVGVVSAREIERRIESALGAA